MSRDPDYLRTWRGISINGLKIGSVEMETDPDQGPVDLAIGPIAMRVLYLRGEWPWVLICGMACGEVCGDAKSGLHGCVDDVQFRNGSELTGCPAHQ